MHNHDEAHNTGHVVDMSGERCPHSEHTNSPAAGLRHNYFYKFNLKAVLLLDKMSLKDHRLDLNR